MQKPARHGNQPIRLNGNNGPEGGGGSGGYPMRLCGAGGGQGASQPPAPQGPPQDKPPIPIHQAHLQNHMTFPAHVRPTAVSQHAPYFHQTQQIRAQRPHQYPTPPRQPIVLSSSHLLGGQENYFYPVHPLMSVPIIYPSPAATAQLPPSDGGSGRSNSSNLNVPGGPNQSFSWANNNPNMAALITPSHSQQPQPANYPQSYSYTPIRVPYASCASTPTLQQPQPNSQHHPVMVPPSMNNGGGGGGGGGGGVGGSGPLMSGNTGSGVAPMAPGQGSKAKNVKRPNAIKIINPDTMEEVKMGEEEQSMQGDHSSAQLQHDLHNSISQENVATVDRRIPTEFTQKVVAVVEPSVGARTGETDEEEVCVNGPTVAAVPSPPVHAPPSVPAPEIDTKRLGPTPVVSAAAANTPTYDVHHNRSTSSRTAENRSSGSPGRSKVNTAVPPQSAVKSQPPPSLAPPLVPPPLFPPSEEPREVPVAQPKHQRKPREDKKPPAVAASASVAPLATTAPAAAPAPVPSTAPAPTPTPVAVVAAPPPIQAQQPPQPLLPPTPAPMATSVQPATLPPQVVSVEQKVGVVDAPRSSPSPPAPVEEPCPAPVLPVAAPPPILAPPPVSAPPPDVRKTNFADSLDIQKTAMAAMSALAASQPIVTAHPPPLMDEKIEEKPHDSHPPSKALQKSRPKKAQKSREINQKGMEKEGGSDMDAFYDPRSVVRVEAGAEQAGEAAAEAPATRNLSHIPVAPPETLDDDNSDSSELAMVSAKNEENAKLSLQNSEEEEIKTQVIERTQAPSTPQLKYDYKDDQWSPLNPSGKKIYDRDFLLKLRKDPLSSKKPEHIKSDLEIFLKDKDLMNNNNPPMKTPLFPSRGPFSGPNMSMQRGNNFAPDWLSRSQSSSQRERMMSKRSSQPGRPGGGSRSSNRMGYNSSLSLRDDFKLNQVENAWKPQKLQRTMESKAKEDAEKEDLFRKVRGILNKLTPQKFEILINQFKALPINNIDRLQGTISLVFEKAVDEPAFSVSYADLCRTLAKMEVAMPPPAPSTEEVPEGQSKPATSGINFRKLLINRCQQEFEANKKAEMDFEKKQQEINECKDNDKRKELQVVFNEEERKIRMKSVGLVRFIGELYKLKMLTAKIMHGCIRQLLDRIDEESLECLCKLLSTIGKELEQTIASTKDQAERARSLQEWNEYFSRMAKLSKKYDGTKVSSRVRFMLQDAIELRENKWVPRRDENKPKTMEQIQAEVERESEKAAMLAATQRRPEPDRSAPRRNNPKSNVPGEDGWTTFSSKSNYKSSYCPESTKIQAIKTVAALDTGGNLSMSCDFSKWGSGASTKSHEQRKNFADNNAFAALLDDKKPPPMSSRSAKPSMSSERERAIQGIKDFNLGRQENVRPPAGSHVSNRNDSGKGKSGPSPASPSQSLSGPPRRGDTPAVKGRPRSPPSSDQPAPSEVPQAAPTPPNPLPPSKPLVDEAKLDGDIHTIIEEFLCNKNHKEGIEGAQEVVKNCQDGGTMFLQISINMILERGKADDRLLASEFLAHLMKADVIIGQILVSQIQEVFDSAEDVAIDIPKIWQYLGELIGTLLALDVLHFDHVITFSKPVKGNKNLESMLREIFRIILVENGPVKIKQQWDSSGMKLGDFVVEANQKQFLQDFAFLEGNKVVVGDTNISFDKVELKLLNFLKSSQEDNFDNIFDWITVNVGKRTEDPLFIGILTKAVITASLSDDSKRVDKDLFGKNMILIRRYVDNHEELELRCLYAVQHLVVMTLESPFGMLVDIFNELYDSNVISPDGFQKWRNPSHEETGLDLQNKGVALALTGSFFSALADDNDDLYDDQS